MRPAERLKIMIMTNTIKVEVDFDHLNIDDIVSFLESKKYKVFEPMTIMEIEKLAHFNIVFRDYSLSEIENLLPRK